MEVVYNDTVMIENEDMQVCKKVSFLELLTCY